jgi:hypothetical protein
MDESRRFLILSLDGENYAIPVAQKLDDATMVRGKAPGVDPLHVKGIAYEDDQKIIIPDFERLLHAG